MIHLLVLYGHPKDPPAFEAYYLGTHMPMAYRALGPHVTDINTARFMDNPDGSQPAHYRSASIYFASAERMQAALATPDVQHTVADLENFASGGYTMLVGQMDEPPAVARGEAATAAHA